MTENELIKQYAETYATCLVRYGVDVRERLETATQISLSLECAYMKGRHEEYKSLEQYIEELKAYRAIGTVEELQKSVKEEDVLKFYYIESEGKYVVGQRVDTLYYAEVGKTGLAFYMSRYLPWGEHVVAPDTLWKEYTYPSEPKEIPFFDWLQGFMKKEYGGTIEEFKALKEKAEPKKRENNKVIYSNDSYAYCPHCRKCIEMIYASKCDKCGAELDWQ